MTATRSRGAWTKEKRDYLARVVAVLDALRDWWPLTLRQVYYQLVAAQEIENKLAHYKKLSRILTQARIDGKAPWEAIEDRGRRTLASAGWASATAFVLDEANRFLDGYRRDLLARQPVALEVWIEKDALAEVAHRAAFPLCVPVIVARGFSSVSYLDSFRRRVLANSELGARVTRVLYFGDLDPSGWAMLPTMLVTLKRELGLGRLVEGVRCGLTPEQVIERNLPFSVDALKQSDTRTRSFQEWLRDEGVDDTMAVELDALPPAELQRLVVDSIHEHLDADQFDEDVALERMEQTHISTLRTRVMEFIRSETT